MLVWEKPTNINRAGRTWEVTFNIGAMALGEEGHLHVYLTDSSGEMICVDERVILRGP